MKMREREARQRAGEEPLIETAGKCCPAITISSSVQKDQTLVSLLSQNVIHSWCHMHSDRRTSVGSLKSFTKIRSNVTCSGQLQSGYLKVDGTTFFNKNTCMSRLQ